MLAAILIVKGTADEAAHLERCLKSIQGHVDGIFLNINHLEGVEIAPSVQEVAKKYTENIIETVWHDNFSEARNANLAQVPKEFEWVIWLDSDDSVKHPEKMRGICEESKQFDIIHVNYEYDHDEYGNITTEHTVGRLFKNNGSQQWNPKVRIHEVLQETRSSIKGITKDFTVIHHAETERTKKSFERNIRMLELQLKDELHDPDARTYYYLASTYIDAGENEKAKDLFNKYLEISGWDQERSVALNKLGKIYLSEGDKAEARKYFSWSHAEDPFNPEPRVELASIEVELEQWTKAVSWLKEVEQMDSHQTTLEVNPLTMTFRTYILLAECYLNIGGKYLSDAEKYAKKALKYRKTDPNTIEYVTTISNVNRDRKRLQEIVSKYQKQIEKGNKKKAQKILEDIPAHLADNPLVAKLLQQGKPFTWPKQSIAIMTGDTAIDAWGPWSLSEGIGGSEEAIIRLAPKLAALGYKVVVYGKPSERTGMYDGVMWRNFWDCNLEDKFDIFIAWRAPFLFDHKINARKKYLWLHDVMEPGEFTPERIKNFTKCIVLSKYHRELFPMIPDEKILLSGNGIDSDEFSVFDVSRDPHKVFYGSSHVRGLQYLYAIWPEVKKAVPDATLDVYYGRESYDKINAGNPERMKWMDDMMQTAHSLDGVTDHGKIGQDEIVRKMFASGVWSYPCPFPEIFCITAIKTQAAGCIPVSTNFAALDETVQFGTKINIPNDGGVGRADEAFLKEYKDKLIWWLKHPEEQDKERQKMMDWARTLSWNSVAQSWNKDFTN